MLNKTTCLTNLGLMRNFILHLFKVLIMLSFSEEIGKNIERFLNKVQKGPFWGMPGPVCARFGQIWA